MRRSETPRSRSGRPTREWVTSGGTAARRGPVGDRSCATASTMRRQGYSCRWIRRREGSGSTSGQRLTCTPPQILPFLWIRMATSRGCRVGVQIDGHPETPTRSAKTCSSISRFQRSVSFQENRMERPCCVLGVSREYPEFRLRPGWISLPRRASSARASLNFGAVVTRTSRPAKRFSEERTLRSRLPHLVPFILARSEEHTSELQSLAYLVCRLL